MTTVDNTYRVAWVPGTDIHTAAGAIAAGGTLVTHVPDSKREAGILALHLNAECQGQPGTYIVVTGGQ